MFQFQPHSIQILEPFCHRLETASFEDTYHEPNLDAHLDQKTTARSLRHERENGWESPGTESFQKGRYKASLKSQKSEITCSQSDSFTNNERCFKVSKSPEPIKSTLTNEVFD
jgi:hypothetical protein